MAEYYPYVIPSPPKTVKEALAVAQTAVRHFYGPDHNYQNYQHVFAELIEECDSLRPVKPDGKHDGPSEERCTPYCGCPKAGE